MTAKKRNPKIFELKSKRSEKLKAALDYAELGLQILPVYTVSGGGCDCAKGKACARPGKHPCTKHGVKDATSNAKALKALWKKYPNANIGAATGKVSGLIVLDIDPRNGGSETLKALEEELGKLPLTPKAKTGGGGYHYFFAAPNKPMRSGKALGAGIDFLAEGSYVIMPGSDGLRRKYQWIKGKNIKYTAFAELPKVWIGALSGGKKAVQPTQASDGGAGSIPEGSRNSTLTSLAGVLRRAGMDQTAILAALTAQNAKCTPQLDEAEVARIAASVAAYPPGPSTKSPDPALNVVNTVLSQYFDGGHHVRLEQGRFWVYESTHWLQASDDWIRHQILVVVEQTGVTGRNASALVKQSFELLKARLAVRHDHLGYLENPKPVVNTQSGEVWIADDGSVELRPHSPESFQRQCLDIAYDPDAKCPKYDRALEGIFSKAKDPKAMIRHWHELVGYILQPSRNIPLVVLAVGRGSNGKTVLLRTVVMLLGESLVCFLPIGDFDKSRFAKSSLFGKFLLLDDDVEDGVRLPDGFLKTISEGKSITVEEKYKAAFTFRARTVPVLLCNNPPTLSDLSHGMQRRLMVIPFSKIFKEEQKDDQLFPNIWAEELPGVLNRAIEGLKRLRARGTFELPKDIKVAKIKYLKSANPLLAFIEERCMRERENNTLVADLYVAYSSWCDEAGVTKKQQRKKFRQNLVSLGFKEVRHSDGWKIIGIKIT